MFIIANVVNRFLNTDVRGYVLNPLIEEKLFSQSPKVTDNVQPICNKRKTIFISVVFDIYLRFVIKIASTLLTL